MGQDASIMQEILSAWKSRVVKIWLRYGWDYMNRQMLHGWNNRIADAFAVPFAEDSESIGFDGSQLVGRTKIISTLRQIFADHPSIWSGSALTRIAPTATISSAPAASGAKFCLIHSATLPRVFPELTERERELLTLIAQGYTNTAIAEKLVLSPKTVRNHVSNIFSKLQVADRAAAIIRARDAGLK